MGTGLPGGTWIPDAPRGAVGTAVDVGIAGDCAEAGGAVPGAVPGAVTGAASAAAGADASPGGAAGGAAAG